jgi:putative transcriptional regulator
LAVWHAFVVVPMSAPSRQDEGMTGRVELAAGRMLLALPSLLDPNFARSVVYLLEHDPEGGSTGVVVNRPTRTPVGQVLPAWEDTMAEPDVVFRGGPVQQNGALCLAKMPAPDDQRPTSGIRVSRHGVGLVDLDWDADEVRSAVRQLRVFAGYAGWSAGQLKSEIDRADWYVVRGDSAEIFSADPETLWQRLWRREPYPASLLSSYPENPTFN